MHITVGSMIQNDDILYGNTSHIIKRTGKMIKIDSNNAFTGLKFDTEWAKIWYFRNPGED